MQVQVGGEKLLVRVCHTLVIGAGAAGLNCADELKRRDVDVLLAADDFMGGTSRNAGSDKQTYHKISLRGDSVQALAETFFTGGNMHGDTALALAAGSARAFYKLVGLGVPFPHDAYGEFAGYQTDHDTLRRATSAGPLTSRFMTERLAESCALRGVPRVEGTLVRLLTSGGRVCGALLLDGSGQKQGSQALTVVLCGQVVLCTGGSADLYEDSVHPTQQVGGLGAALRLGARAANLWSWQYGIASKGFRWNLSGTYQQVLPRYVDETGRPVLEGWTGGNPDDAVFLKGYQWPFDSRKRAGSSQVDLAVQAAIAEGRQVFLDYRQPDEAGRLDRLDEEARAYLKASGANQNTPFKRLMHMNPAAVELYRSHDIDLERELLPIAVCAQHQNGGLAVDAWWRTSLPGLHCAGEAAGCFGAYRPGGSALNETQVGSLRIAQWIAARGSQAPQGLAAGAEEIAAQLGEEMAFLEAAGNPDEAGRQSAAEVHAHLRKQFSLCAGPVRQPAAMQALLGWVYRQRGEDFAGTPLQRTRLRDALDCAAATLSSMLVQAREMPVPCGHLVSGEPPQGGGGAAVQPATQQAALASRAGNKKPCAANGVGQTDAGRFAHSWVETVLPAGGGAASSTVCPVRPLPQPKDAWFENVWRDWREGRIFDDAPEDEL